MIALSSLIQVKHKYHGFLNMIAMNAMMLPEFINIKRF